MKCHICNCRVRVTKSGHLYKHRNPQPEKYWAYWCPGSGKMAQASSEEPQASTDDASSPDKPDNDGQTDA